MALAHRITVCRHCQCVDPAKPVDGRCDTCYRYYQKHGAERPLDAVRPTSLLSFMMPIASWYVAHGRLPSAQECRAANGLPHWTALYHQLPVASTFSGRLSAGFMATGITLRPDSVGAPGHKYLPCLGPGCHAAFWTTPEVRLCPACTQRQKLADRGDWLDGQAVTRVELRRWGMRTADWWDAWMEL